jgi:hypothetical protein
MATLLLIAKVETIIKWDVPDNCFGEIKRSHVNASSKKRASGRGCL